MTAISASLVKELRERTSVGMMDCKKALEETKGDIEAAVDLLKAKGLAKAAKKSGRATSEGVVSYKSSADNKQVALVEVKCETDFVSRGEHFQAFAAYVVDKVFEVNPSDSDSLNKLVEEELNSQIATLGENMSIGRFCKMEAGTFGTIGSYIHSNGKIGVLVEVTCKKEETEKNPLFLELAKNLAMQIAATSPLSVDPSGVDPAVVEREREIAKQKTIEEGKPANIAEKIVDGRIQKFYQEICLLEQAYIRDDKVTIKQLLKDQGKSLNDELAIVKFIRLQLDENA